MNSDMIIIKALKSKDANRISQAFESLYNKYSKLVYFCISKYISNKDDIHELTNDVFINVFNNIEKLNETKNIKYYLTTCAKNSAINFIKLKKLDIINDNDLILSTPDSSKNYQEIIDEMKRFISDKELEIIIMHLIKGYSFKEIGIEKNQSINTVKSTYLRALKKIKL